MGRWSVQETAEVAEVRLKLGDLLTNRPQFPEVVGDRKIIRFLRGHDHKIDKVVEMYSKYLNWRVTSKVDDIRENIIMNGINHPSKFPSADKILPLIPQIVIDPNACDKLGSPICIDQYNFSPSEVLEKLTIDEYIQFVIYCLEYRSIIIEQLSEEKEQKFLLQQSQLEVDSLSTTDVESEPYGVIINTAVIRDMGGIGFEHLGTQGQSIINSVVSLATDNYPGQFKFLCFHCVLSLFYDFFDKFYCLSIEMMKKCYMINTPWIFNTIWYFIKGLLAARTINKVILLGTSYMIDLEADIHIDSIPGMILSFTFIFVFVFIVFLIFCMFI